MRIPETTHDWIDRWQERSLVTAEVASRLHDDVTTASASASGRDTEAGRRRDDADLTTRLVDAAVRGGKEAMAYVGAALTFGTLAVLADVTSWSEPALMVLLGLITMLGAAAVVRLTPAGGATGRLAGVAGASSVLGLTGLMVLLSSGTETLPIAGVLPVLVLSSVLFWRHRHLLLHLTTGAALTAAIVAVAEPLGPGTEGVVAGVLLLVAAVGWVVATELDVLGSPWVGTPLAVAVAHVGVALVTDVDLFGAFDATIVASLVLAAVVTTAGALADRIRLIIAGSVGLVVTVPMTCTEVLGLSPTTTAALLLPVGLVLLAVTLVPALRTRVTSS